MYVLFKQNLNRILYKVINLTFSLLRYLGHLLLPIYYVKLHFWSWGRSGILFYTWKSERSIGHPSGILSRSYNPGAQEREALSPNTLGLERVEFFIIPVPVAMGVSYNSLGNMPCPPEGLCRDKDSWIGKDNSVLQKESSFFFFFFWITAQKKCNKIYSRLLLSYPGQKGLSQSEVPSMGHLLWNLSYHLCCVPRPWCSRFFN